MVANSPMNAIWIRKDKMKENTRIKLYKSLVKSILLYNCGTWGLTKHQEDMLDAHHRKQLRRVLNIRYPTKIRNKRLCEIAMKFPFPSPFSRRDGNYLATSSGVTKTSLQTKSWNFISPKSTPLTKTLKAGNALIFPPPSLETLIHCIIKLSHFLYMTIHITNALFPN